MSINRSQQFYYFQNKAHHYQNIKNAKSSIDDKLGTSISNLINNSTSPMRRRQSHFRKYQINHQNQALMSRLCGIMKSKKTQVSVTGNYSRSNNPQRNFRKSNPHKEQQSRLIDLENKKINLKLNHTKAIVGSVDRWKEEYGSYITHRQHLSRYDKEDQLKSSLEISVEKFVPKPYRTILNTEQQQQLHKRKKITLNAMKLTQLPPLQFNQNKSRVQTVTKKQNSDINNSK